MDSEELWAGLGAVSGALALLFLLATHGHIQPQYLLLIGFGPWAIRFITTAKEVTRYERV